MTQEIQFPFKSINIEKLDEDCRNAIGEKFLGISIRDDIALIISDMANQTDIDTVTTIFNVHDEAQLSTTQQLLQSKQANQIDVNSRFDLSVIKNKTPAEIYTAMQNKIDSWTSLADAQSDLREWLPLLASIIAWKVQE